jgi:hypothetical protein
MKIQIRQRPGGGWFISIVSHVGFANGRTVYDSADDAAAAAYALHPDKPIELMSSGSEPTHAIRSLFDRAAVE